MSKKIVVWNGAGWYGKIIGEPNKVVKVCDTGKSYYSAELCAESYNAYDIKLCAEKSDAENI